MLDPFYKNPAVIAAWRTIETSVLASFVVFFTLLVGFIQTNHAFTGFDWANALTSLEIGVAIGVGNGVITLINLLIQSLKGTTS